MKILLIGLLLALSSPAADMVLENPHPRTSKRVWIRRATLAAGCAASLVFDTLSTRRATNAGAVESNGLFASPQGSPQWGRMIGFKAGLCGATAVMEETHMFHAWKNPNADWTWTGVNAATTALYTWTGFHNMKLANDLSSK